MFFATKKGENPDYALRRIGVYAGTISRDIEEKSEQSHYFIKVEANSDLFVVKYQSIHWELDNTVGPNSISKQEFIREINTKYFFNDKLKSLDISFLFKPLSNTLLRSGNELINNSIQFFNSYFNIILILVISFYMSLEFEKIKSFFNDLAGKSRFKDFKKLTTEIDHVLSKFIRGQGLICLFLAAFYAISLLLVGIKFGILLGIFSGIISFIPYVGAFLGGGLTLVLGFFQFGMSIEMLILLLIFVSGQLLESYYLTPKFVGNAINLNPIWIMFALLTGAHLAGFVGVLISLPIAAIFGVLVRHYIVKLF